ncbi:MAG: type 4a pilus biogenesis protein PilO [Firmicutes bacterium]|nr:type 4a pilus biogenesis protein PilO [Bacillota bacterium]
MKLKIYFIIANVLIFGIILYLTIPPRIQTIQNQATLISLQQRQLATMEANLHLYEENLQLIQNYLEEETYIINPTGYLGVLLTDIRAVLQANNLSEQQFSATEQAVHQIDGRNITELRINLTADGNFNNISSFIQQLTENNGYVRIERIQLDNESSPMRLLLTFATYEEI